MQKDDRKFLTTLWVAYFLFLELSSLGETSEVSPCIVVSQEQSGGDQSGYQSCAAVHEAIFRLGKFIWENATHDNIIAFGTVMIALFTLTLWWSTSRLWKAGEKHSERELRAYVDVVKGQVLDFGTGANVRIRVIIKNSGKTPAYNYRHWMACGADDIPPKRGFPKPSPPFEGYRATIAPGEYHTSVQEYGPLAVNHITKIAGGAAALWAWGEMTYEDAFGRERKSWYRLKYTGRSLTDPPGGMVLDQEGNGAN